jgi:(S)-mandelate dehydrogenase
MNIADLRNLAHRYAPPFVMEHVEGGADDEVTLVRNRSAFERITFRPLTLQGAQHRDLSTTLLGKTVCLPIVIAPMALNGLLRHNGDILLAKAAERHGIPFTLATLATTPIEDVAAQAGGNLWFQLYNIKREYWAALALRAKVAGCSTLVLTTDAPIYGNREWAARHYNGVAELKFRSRAALWRHLRWLHDVMVRHGQPRFAHLDELLASRDSRVLKSARFVSAQLDPTMVWEDVKRLRELWRGPLVLKGILTASDALQALQVGIDAVVISNHGGRQLDGTPSPMEVLGEIAGVVGRRLTILIDSGFRRGTDVVKALAMGAQGVMIGRAALYGLIAGGEAGAVKALDIFKREIEVAMTLLGIPTIGAIGPEAIHQQ